MRRSQLLRYRDALAEVEEKGAHRKLRKYAKKALSQLSESDDTQYIKGHQLLTTKKVAHTSKAKAEPVVQANQDLQPLTVIQVGMCVNEVYALAGQPHITQRQSSRQRPNR